MEGVFSHIKANFLNRAIKRLMNCFGIIYLVQADYIDNGKKYQEEVNGATLESLTRKSLLDLSRKNGF